VNRRKAELALLCNATLWGGTFVLVKGALHEISPVLFLAMRFSLATVALVVLFSGTWMRQGSKAPRVTGKMLAAGAMIGLFLFAGYLLVYQVKPQVSEVAGVLTATLGMGLMTLEGPLASISRGDLLTFGGAIAFAAHIVATGHFAEQVGYEVLSVTQMGAAALSALSLVWWVETPRVQWQPLVVWAILITGLLCTALAFTIQAWAQHYTTSTRTALIYALEPVVAWVTSACIAGEGLSRQAAAGAALILSGVLLVEMKPFHPRRHL
jgi:drug/metabolite transporter (DMT)-like permease